MERSVSHPSRSGNGPVVRGLEVQRVGYEGAFEPDWAWDCKNPSTSAKDSRDRPVYVTGHTLDPVR